MPLAWVTGVGAVKMSNSGPECSKSAERVLKCIIAPPCPCPPFLWGPGEVLRF